MFGKFTACALIALLLILGALSLYKIKSSDAYQVKQLENKGIIPRLDRSAELLGPDEDNNGIRDDIDKYIRKTFKDEKQRKAVEQYARNMQKALTIEENDREAAIVLDEEDSRAYNCLRFIYGLKNHDKYSRIVNNIHSLTLNTKARSLQYLKYDALLDGTTTSLPRGDTCD